MFRFQRSKPDKYVHKSAQTTEEEYFTSLSRHTAWSYIDVLAFGNIMSSIYLILYISPWVPVELIKLGLTIMCLNMISIPRLRRLSMGSVIIDRHRDGHVIPVHILCLVVVLNMVS